MALATIPPVGTTLAIRHIPSRFLDHSERIALTRVRAPQLDTAIPVTLSNIRPIGSHLVHETFRGQVSACLFLTAKSRLISTCCLPRCVGLYVTGMLSCSYPSRNVRGSKKRAPALTPPLALRSNRLYRIASSDPILVRPTTLGGVVTAIEYSP